jgi:hypothetical protein
MPVLMHYAKAFFDLQVEFAEAVSALSGLPLARTLFEYTNFYIRFGLGRDFDPAHAIWQEYLAGLPDADRAGRRDWTHRFYAARASATAAGPPVAATVGCFSYARSGSAGIRLHFQNAETDGQSPLGRDRRACRRAELTALFAHVKQTVPPTGRVAGTSWLYNLDAYRGLFPEAYVATARPVLNRFRHMPLWGQFVDRRGEVRAAMARELLERLARQTSLEGLDRCFPFPALAVEGSVREFYERYGL